MLFILHSMSLRSHDLNSSYMIDEESINQEAKTNYDLSMKDSKFFNISLSDRISKYKSSNKEENQDYDKSQEDKPRITLRDSRFIRS